MLVPVVFKLKPICGLFLIRPGEGSYLKLSPCKQVCKRTYFVVIFVKTSLQTYKICCRKINRYWNISQWMCFLNSFSWFWERYTSKQKSIAKSIPIDGQRKFKIQVKIDYYIIYILKSINDERRIKRMFQLSY